VVVGMITVTSAMTERILFHAGTLSPANILNYAEGCATLLTSIWTVLIVLAMAMLRLLSPLARVRRLVRWGWDVRATPVMALGWMMAVLVFLVALVYGIV
jgi:NADH:ubiquinone oxidoreductase subunit H